MELLKNLLLRSNQSINVNHQIANPKRKTKRWLNEVKTWTINEAKWKSANDFCETNDMEFKILTEDHLNIKYK